MKKLISFLVCVNFLAASAQEVVLHKAFKEKFSKPASKYFKNGSAGQDLDFKSNQGVRSTSEPKSKILSLKLNPEEKAGAGKGPEIISKNFTHFGTYSARLKVPDVKEIQPNVGAVVGYFTYHMDKEPGLSEIDFEWLLADPSIIYIGTWTGKHGALQRVGRTINLKEGTIYTTESKTNHNGQSTQLTGLQNQPETIAGIMEYDASSRFYTYGFDWYPDRLLWWMIHPDTNEKIVLWDYQGSTLGIPQNASRYRMNFWHTDAWSVETNPLSLEKPKDKYALEVDWMSYEPLNCK